MVSHQIERVGPVGASVASRGASVPTSGSSALAASSRNDRTTPIETLIPMRLPSASVVRIHLNCRNARWFIIHSNYDVYRPQFLPRGINEH